MSLVQALASRSGPASSLDEDVRLDDLQEMFANKHLLDWRRALDLSQDLVVAHGPDLRPLAFGALAAFRVRGWVGLCDGLDAWHVALADRWEDVGPKREALRVAPARRLMDALTRWLVTAVEQSTSRDEDVLPPVDDVAVLRRCLSSGRALASDLATRFGDKVPVDGRWLGRLEAMADEAEAEVAPSAAPAPAPPPIPAPRAAAPRPSPRPAPEAPEAPSSTATPDQLREGLGKLRTSALPWLDQLQAAEPGRPEAWRLARDLAWASVTRLPSTTITSGVSPDPGVLRRVDDAAARLDAADKAWRRHILWLDPHRVVAECLRLLGHTDAADAVTQTVASLARRHPWILEASYRSEGVVQRPDGTVGPAEPVPCADAATRQWLSSANPGRAPAAQALSVDSTAASPPQASMAELDALLGRAEVSEALVWWSQRARGACPRDRALLAANVGGRLIDAGHAALALPALLAADEDIRRHDLDAWEPELVCDVLGKVLTAARVDPGALDEATLVDARRRIARLGHLHWLAPAR